MINQNYVESNGLRIFLARVNKKIGMKFLKNFCTKLSDSKYNENESQHNNFLGTFLSKLFALKIHSLNRMIAVEQSVRYHRRL